MVLDVLAFDTGSNGTGSKRLYISSESGVVAVAGERGRKLVKLGQAFLASNAHTVAVDPATHLVYFPARTRRRRPPRAAHHGAEGLALTVPTPCGRLECVAGQIE